MSDVSFEIDRIALMLASAAILLGYLLWRYFSSYADPYLFFSSLSPSDSAENNKLKKWDGTQGLRYASLCLLLLAFIDPHFFISRELSNEKEKGEGIPAEGLAIYLLLDQSGSMLEEVSANLKGQRVTMTKEDLLKKVTRDFILGDPSEGLKGRPNDLIGLVAFARVPDILSPLTLDHQELLKQLSHLQVIQKKEEDGTAIGYAIFKTTSMIAATKHFAKELSQKGSPSYNIKNAIIILITDGLQDPSILDKESRLRNIGLEQAARFAKENGVRLYLINIDPRTYAEDLAPQRKQMEKITQLTGGRLYIVNDPGDLSQIYADIDRLQRSALPQIGLSKKDQPNAYRRFSLYPYFILLSMFFLGCSILLETVFVRKVP